MIQAQTGDLRSGYGSIGWSAKQHVVLNPVKRKVLLDQPHKRAYDFGQLRDTPQLQTTGFFADHVDSWLGIPFDFLDGLSVREQRIVVKQRVTEIMRK